MESFIVDMSPQGALNRAYTHLWQQNCQSFDPQSHSCKYDGPNGTGCAFAPFMPDEFKNSCEFNPVSKLHEYGVVIFKDAGVELFQAMQQAHDCYSQEDDSYFRQYITKEFIKIAKEFNIPFVPLTEAE